MPVSLFLVRLLSNWRPSLCLWDRGPSKAGVESGRDFSSPWDEDQNSLGGLPHRLPGPRVVPGGGCASRTPRGLCTCRSCCCDHLASPVTWFSSAPSPGLDVFPRGTPSLTPVSQASPHLPSALLQGARKTPGMSLVLCLPPGGDPHQSCGFVCRSQDRSMNVSS